MCSGVSATWPGRKVMRNSRMPSTSRPTTSASKIGYRSGQADALRVLGDLAESPERARDYYLRARELYRQTGNVPADEVTERALRNLGGT